MHYGILTSQESIKILDGGYGLVLPTKEKCQPHSSKKECCGIVIAGLLLEQEPGQIACRVNQLSFPSLLNTPGIVGMYKGSTVSDWHGLKWDEELSLPSCWYSYALEAPMPNQALKLSANSTASGEDDGSLLEQCPRNIKLSV